ncbi:helix-turn-helix transcriptional regulator (plasmid) [Streptomyces sp. BI20]|uniref:helix-turn-helix transcriptional regulator n=1 Tax=Streptomyces sp. BI20 TaxID=3403460 RepID=UPI003C7153C1
MSEASDYAKRIGQVIRAARRHHDWSQARLADVVGYSQSKISRLESGTGKPEVTLVRAIAEVLGIPLERLGLSAAPHPHDEEADLRRRTILTAAGATAITAVTDTRPAHALIGVLMPSPTHPATRASENLDVLHARTTAVRAQWHGCDYTALAHDLPGLVSDLRHHAATTPTERAHQLLATAYQTCGGLLLKQGDTGTAWLAATRAMAAAEQTEDPAALAAASRLQAHVLLRDTHTQQAVTLVQHVAAPLLGSYDKRTPRYLAALGLLLLRGATAAGRNKAPDTAAAFLAEAHEVARYVQLDSVDGWAVFSPTNVELHTLAHHVTNGDTTAALRAVTTLSRRHIPVPERRAALWLDAARAFDQRDRLTDAAWAIGIAETCAPQEVQRPAVRALVRGLAARDGARTIPELHQLARRIGAQP